MQPVSRRTVVAGLVATAATHHRQTTDARSQTLWELARSKGLLFGAAVLKRHLDDDPHYASAVTQNCNVLVAEGEMKWGAVEWQRGTLDFSAGDAIAAFARLHGQKLRGHALIWHQALPPWVADVVTSGQGPGLIERHIQDECRHFGADVMCWDVANEAVSVGDGRPDGLRRSLWLEHIGPQYLDIAYHAARKALPATPLYYNDYGLEQDEPSQDKKRRAVITLLEGFRKRNVPVDGVGIQAHLLAGLPFNVAKFRAFIRDVAQMNYTIHITELDVRDVRLPADVRLRDVAVADLTSRFLDTALDEPNVRQLLTWGLTDKYSWLNGTPGQGRDDGLDERPLPLDGSYQPKPMMEAIRRSLIGARVRKPDVGVITRDAIAQP